MFERFDSVTIKKAMEIFDTIFDGQISQENPNISYEHAFGEWIIAEVLRDNKLQGA